ncbi:MAG TPA: SAM-dependent chlorinase/fluorinase [Pyrinomonadaceae bacterium]|nr:SAM-dependent chlorinase/fluorinase [Pyrinomonadaceae bacterium]
MIVTLLTDFGTRDYFVGALKGALLSVNPEARVVDITHEVAPHDVEEAAFTLLAAYETFPAGTVHVAVVDPGVGSARRAIAVEGAGQFFVGPDNGVFGHVYERLARFRVFHVVEEKFFREPVSKTFHGRDVFAPVAGALARGTRPRELGPEVTDFVRLPFAAPFQRDASTLVASVIHVDRFGNCVTNVTRLDLGGEANARGARLVAGGRELSSFRDFFADDAGARGEPFAVWGSAGLLEIAVFKDSAARVLGLGRGSEIEVVLGRSC